METILYQECKEKIVNVNGPEIQQPNHDVIDKEQQQGQHFIDVRKSDETAKRININLEILFSFVKYFLLIVLVSLPVADCNQQDFKWLPTDTIVKGVNHIDVQLVWKYTSNVKLDKIDISRKKTEYEKEDVAMWTPDEGSKPNTLLSTDVTLKHRKEGDVDTVILTLVDPYPVDFDKQYSCAVSFEHGVDSMEIELQSYRVEYQPVADVVKARPGDDVQFVWIYKYPLPVTTIFFYKDDDTKNLILTWSRSDGVYDIEDEYKNRVDVNITTNKGQEEVILTLHNVTRGDFDLKYCSSAMAANGCSNASKINLIPLPDFKWLPTNKIVKGLYQTDVRLLWKYQSNLTLYKINISQKKTEYEKEDVAMWTPDEGSKPNTSLSNDVTLEHRKEGDVGTIILTLIKPYPVDFDKKYYCTVYFENGFDSMEIELQSYKVEYQPVADVVKARPGDDVQFVWIYKYPLPVSTIFFYTDNAIQNIILTWIRDDSIYIIEDEYKNRIAATITTNKDQEEVTLTLRNVTRGDYDQTFCSLPIADNGGYNNSQIILIPVEEEKAGQKSSASNLSKDFLLLLWFLVRSL